MKTLPKKSLLAVAVSLGLTFVVDSAFATYCHNIGGPNDLGANCDQTGTCSYVFGEQTITVTPPHFLGILIPPTSIPNGRALAAHIAHGDGPVEITFDPPLHLASAIGPHRASNVECLGHRMVEQPPEPGN